MGWYVDQMKRQTYESDSLPISLKSNQYSNGKLDVAYVFDLIKEPVSVKNAFEILTSDDKNIKRNLRIRDDIDLIISKNLFINVDSAAAINSGTVDVKNANKIVDKLEIDLSNKSYLGKQEIVILDLLQNNNWERPVYFAVTVGGDNYLGLSKYFQLEGMAYRIVPIKGQDMVNTDAMFDNMINKFKWGGVENPNVYLDENNLRMTSTFRHMFSRLVGALIAEGKKDKALEALDYSMKVLPPSTVPHTYISVYLAAQSYQLGEKEKAEAILNDMLKNSLQYVKWYSSLSDIKLKSVSQDYGQHLAIISEIFKISQGYGNEELIETNYPLFVEYSRKYNTLRR